MIRRTQKPSSASDPFQHSHLNNDRKKDGSRKQLETLKLLGLFNHLNPTDGHSVSQPGLMISEQNLKREASAATGEQKQKIRTKFQHKQTKTGLSAKQKIRIDKQNSSIELNSKFSLTLPAGFKQKEQHREERSHFQKMSLLIDRKDKRCSLKQSVQNLVILTSSITKVKTLIYKHYKVIMQRKEQHQMNAIKYYSFTLSAHFKELISLIQNNIDKNQNYKKYLRSLKKFEPIISKETSNLEQHLQGLLFYFSSIIELKRFYQVSSNSEEFISKVPSQDVSNITHHTIRIRHYLGFIAKFIADPLMQSCGSLTTKPVLVEESKNIWRQIYQKKYTSKANKNVCK